MACLIWFYFHLLQLSYQIVDALIWLGIGDIINEFRKKKLKLRPITYLSGSYINPQDLPYGYIWSPQLLPKPKGEVCIYSPFWRIDVFSMSSSDTFGLINHQHYSLVILLFDRGFPCLELTLGEYCFVLQIGALKLMLSDFVSLTLLQIMNPRHHLCSGLK